MIAQHAVAGAGLVIGTDHAAESLMGYAPYDPMPGMAGP